MMFANDCVIFTLRVLQNSTWSWGKKVVNKRFYIVKILKLSSLIVLFTSVGDPDLAPDPDSDPYVTFIIDI